MQFMRLAQKYFTLNYHHYKDVSELIDNIKVLDEQIDAMEVKITPDK